MNIFGVTIIRSDLAMSGLETTFGLLFRIICLLVIHQTMWVRVGPEQFDLFIDLCLKYILYLIVNISKNTTTHYIGYRQIESYAICKFTQFIENSQNKGIANKIITKILVNKSSYSLLEWVVISNYANCPSSCYQGSYWI